ncbi:hypothetical protein Q7P37_009741 [Cladosporium fusiforme]
MADFKSRLVRATASVAATFAFPWLGKSAHLSREESSKGLIVADAVNADDSIVEMSTATIRALRLSRGDVVLVEGKKGKDTILVVLCGDSVDYGAVRISYIVRRNLCVRLDDVVTVRPCPAVEYARSLSVSPTASTINGADGLLSELELFDVFLDPYFRGQYRPLREGDVFTCRKASCTANFAVVGVDPPEYGIVSDDTEIHCSTRNEQVLRAGKCRHALWSLYNKTKQKLQGLVGARAHRGHSRSLSSSPSSPSLSSWSKEALLKEYRTSRRCAL